VTHASVELLIKMDGCQRTLDPKITVVVTEFEVPTNVTVNCRKDGFDPGLALDDRVASPV
jgi:hypothetical protein